MGKRHVGKAHAVTDADAFDAGAHGHYLARAFVAGDIGCSTTQGVLAAAAVDVGKVQADGVHGQLDMARWHGRVGQFAPF